MKSVFLIAGRESRAILYSPTGFVVVGLYLLLAGYLFAFTVSVTQEASLRYTFSSLGTLTLFTIPLITMRLISEELRSGTFETLIAHPLSDWHIVLGKFLAGCCVFLVLSLPTLSYLVALEALGSPDWGGALAGYFGLHLLALEMLALGLFISATTHSQVLAAMGGMIGGLLLWLAGTAAYSIRGRLGDALGYLAIFEHYSPFQRGVIDTRSVVYFLSTAAMLLYRAGRAVESRRWKFGAAPGGVPRSWRRPRLSLTLVAIGLLLLGEAFLAGFSAGFWTAYNTVMLALGLGLAGTPFWLNRVRLRYELARRRAGMVFTVLLNSLLVIAIWALVTFLASAYYLRLDLTRTKHYALSPQTVQLLEQIDQPVEVVVAMRDPADLRQAIMDLLDEYAARSPLVQVRFVDPVREPGELEQLRQYHELTSPLANELLLSTHGQVQRIPIASLVRQPTRIVNNQVQRMPAQFVGEAEVTASLIRMTHERLKGVVFLSGHGERDPEDTAAEGAAMAGGELVRQGWTVQSHVVTPGTVNIPENAEVVVMAGARRGVSDEYLSALQQFLERGGGLLALLEPGVDSGLEPLLTPWDIRLADNQVVDLQSHIATADPTNLYVTRFKQDHPVGKGMGSLAAVLPTARRVAVTTTQPNPTVTTWHLMHTSGNGWAASYQRQGPVRINPSTDRRGPISLAVAAERYEPPAGPGGQPKEGRLLVIGDSDFMSNRYIDMAGNLDLFLNCVEWLAGRQDLISIRPKVTDVSRLSLTSRQSKGIFWFSMVGLPATVLLVGIGSLARHRSRF